jgi:excisionase family DNA binding protein
MNESTNIPLVPFEPRLGRSVSLDQATLMLGVSRRTLYTWIRHGRVQTVRTLGGSQRVVIESIRGLATHAGVAVADTVTLQ